MLQVLFMSLLIGNVLSYQNNSVDYYETLVKTNIDQLRDYKAPTDNSEFIPKSSKIYDLPDVDFIIVGSGTAGSIVGNRLSEILQWKILVLETGTYANEFSDIPAMSIHTFNSQYNWRYKSQTQKKASLGVPGNVTYIARGKGIGGTTIINGLRYVRGSRYDFDYWAKKGNPGWSYYEVLPYFKKCENTSIYNADPGYHGYRGPIHVEYYKSPVPHMDLVVDAYKEMGYPILDYNGKSQMGMSRSQLMEINGVRNGVARGYINPILKRKNFKIMDRAYVTKVLIDPNSKSAYGVIFSKDGKLMRVKAKKEVILSAGAVNTPQILLLSGVGPKHHLQSLGIEVVKDLAVGENLIDHAAFGELSFNTEIPVEPKTIREYIKEWLKGEGLYSIAIGLQGVAFYKTKYATKNEGADIILDFIPPNPVTQETLETSSYKKDIAEALFENLNLKTNIHLGVLSTHPLSRGTVRLRSKDPFKFPLIDLNSFSDDRDMDVMYEGIKLALKLQETEVFKKNNIKLAKFELPPCKQYKYLSEDFWKCSVSQVVGGGYHLFGTCRMGPNPKNGDVVDAKLKVHGVKNLRVIDASVIIKLSGYPAAATMMIAEKASDIIKKDYKVFLQSLAQNITLG